MSASEKLDKKNSYLLFAVWLAPLLVSLCINVWWVHSIAGLISLLMGVFVLLRWRSRDARVLAIVMIVVGVLSQGFVIVLYRFSGLHK
jgi:hypothetical protein